MPSTAQLRTLLQGHEPDQVRSVWCDRRAPTGRWAVRVELENDEVPLDVEVASEKDARNLVEELVDRANGLRRG